MKAAAIIVAAGSGRRLGGDTPKQFLELGGWPVLAWSLRAITGHEAIGEVVAVLPAEQSEEPPEWLADCGARVVAGGATRSASVARGLDALSTAAPFVLVHDGVRPFVTAALIGRVAAAAREGAVVPVLPLVDTVKEVDQAGRVVRTLDRSRLVRVQTPQGFPIEPLRAAHEAHAAEGGEGVTDDAQMLERRGVEVRTVPGAPENLKITSAEDYDLARWMVERGRVRRP